MSAAPPRRNEFAGVILHLLFTAFGCAISLGLMGTVYGLLSSPHSHPFDSSSIFNPLFWVPSLFVGLTINHIVRHRWAFAAPAIIGTAIIVGIIIWDVSLFRRSTYELAQAHHGVWRYEFERLFSPVSSLSSDKADRVLTQLFITFPFLSSVAYSLGGFVALKFGRSQIEPAIPTITG